MPKISEYTAVLGDALGATDQFVVNDSGTTKRIDALELAEGMRRLGGEINVKDYGAVGNGVADDSAAFAAAIADINTTGTEIGGFIYLPTGEYGISRQFIIPDATYLGGMPGGTAGTIVRALSTFPSAVKNGAITLPQATIAVDAMPAGAQSTGGVISLISTTGNQYIAYTGISGSSFTGCTGGTGDVADDSIVGFPMFVIGVPYGTPTGAAFAAGLCHVALWLTPDNTGANSTLGGVGVFTNRIQEQGGLRDVGMFRVRRCGFALRQPAAGTVPCDYRILGIRVNSAGVSAEATAAFIDVEAGREVLRGIQDVTISSYQAGQTPAGTTGIRLTGYTGSLRDVMVEYVTTGVLLESSGVAATRCGPCDLENIYGNNNTTLVRVTTVSGFLKPYSLRSLRRAGTSTNLIVDDRIGRTITDLNIGWWMVASENGDTSTSPPTVYTDAIGPRLAVKPRAATASCPAANGVTLMDATGGIRTVTLPTAALIDGAQFTIKKTDSSGNAVTVATTSSQTIDGVTTFSLPTQWDYVTVVSNGTNWFVVAQG